MKYARIQNNVVVEICTPIDGFTIEQCFHPSLVAAMTACDDSVQPGWSFVDGAFSAPVTTLPEEVVEEAPAETPAEPA